MGEVRKVVFHYTDLTGAPLAGRIVFQPTVGLLNAGTDVIIPTDQVSVTLDATGSGSVTLACTDDTSLTPAGWAWAVQEFVPGGRNGDNAYFVLVPTSVANGVGLTDLPGAAPSAFFSAGIGGGGGTGDLTKAAADTYYDPIGTAASGLAGHVAAGDPHQQYETAAEVNAKIAAHEAASNPHPVYLTQAEADDRYSQVTTSGITKAQADTYYDAIGSAVAGDNAHLAASDPHPQYETSAEAAAKVTAHTIASDPHGDRAYAASIADGKANTVHSHVTSDITQLAEFIRDTIGATIVAGSGVSVVVDDAADTITLSGSTIDAEQVQDIVGAMVVNGTNITTTYNDAAGTFTIAVTGLAAVATTGAYADLTGKPALGGAAALNVGTTGGTVAAGNDSRFTDQRTPTDGSVSTAKIVDGAVTSAKIADGTIVDADINASAAIAQSKISGLAASLAGKENTGVAAAAVAAHEAAADPHPSYLTQTEGDARYVQLPGTSKPAGAVWVYLGSAPVGATEPYLLLKDNGDGTFTWQQETGVPGAPTGIAATRGDQQVTVTWTAPTDVGLGTLTYTLERSSDSGSTWGNAITGISGTSRVVTGLTNGTAYLFRVRATTANGGTTYGSSAWNTLGSAVTPAGVPATMSAPSVSAANNSVTVTWTQPSANGTAITGYTIQRKTGAGGTYANLTSPSAGATSYTDSTAANGTTYYYRILATNAVGSGNYSTDSSAATPVSSGGTFQFNPTSNSGSVSSSAAFWPVSAAASGGATSAGLSVTVGAWFDGDFYNVFSALMEFDTSSLDDAATISSVALDVAGGTVDFAGGASTIEVYAYDYGSSITGADYPTRAQVQALTKVATFALDSGGGNWPNASTRVTYALVGTNLAAAINKTGMTRLLFVHSLYSSNADAAAVSASGTAVNFVANGGAAPPRLTVVTS